MTDRDRVAALSTFPVVACHGTPAQIGDSYGQQARSHVLSNVDLYFSWICSETKLSVRDVLEAGEAFRQASLQHAPRSSAIIDALAHAVKLPPAALFALNARTELLLSSPHAGYALPECTTIGVDASFSATGAPILAQTWDWQPGVRENVIVLATRDERGHEVVTLAEAGMLAKAGLNGRGVALVLNVLSSSADGDRGTVPYHLLVRAALDAPSAFEALDVLRAMPRGASINVMVGSTDGRLADIELVPGAHALLSPEAGFLVHANDIESDLGVLDRFEAEGRDGASEERRTLGRLCLTAIAAQRKVGIEDVMTVLALHAGSGSICVHGEDPAAPGFPTQTLAGVVIEPASGSIWIAAGWPCSAKYIRLAVDAIQTAQRPASTTEL